MAFNPFIGWSQTDLETQLRIKQEELARGVQITSTNSGDVSFQTVPTMSTMTAIELILRALYALDPTTYPIDEIVREDRTVYQAPS